MFVSVSQGKAPQKQGEDVEHDKGEERVEGLLWCTLVIVDS